MIDGMYFFDCDVWIGHCDNRPTGGIETPKKLIAEMDRIGIDRALVYHIDGRDRDPAEANRRLLAELAAYPRLEPAWVVSPALADQYGSADKLAEALREAHIKAVRMFPGEQEFALGEAHTRPLLDALNDLGLVVLLECLAGTRSGGFDLPTLGDTCNAHPNIHFVLTELHPRIGRYEGQRGIFDQVERTRNLYLDTPKFQTHEGVRLFCEEFGGERLLFGTYLPHASAGAGVAAVTLSSMAKEDQRKVAGANLLRLFGESPAQGESRRGPDRQTKRPSYGIVDVHGHVRPDATGDEIVADAAGVVAAMDRTGIEVLWASNTKGLVEGNEVMEQAARRYPDRIVPFALGNPNYDKETLHRELDRCFDELGMKAIKIHPVGHNVPAGDPRYKPIWEFANRRRCLVVSHVRANDEEREAFSRAAAEHPDMTLMLYHAARDWDRAPNFIAVAKEHPNVLLEITFSRCVDGIIEHLIEEVGADRVFFGTDIGARAPEGQVGWATYARIDEETRYKLMRANGLRLMRQFGALPDSMADAS